MKKAAIYLRVSTTDQTVENQRRAIEQYCQLQGWRVAKVYEDVGVSGAQDRREGLDALKKDATNGKFDVVLVWKFDRLARSTQHLLEVLALLQRYGVDFVSRAPRLEGWSSLSSGRLPSLRGRSFASASSVVSNGPKRTGPRSADLGQASMSTRPLL
jgi:DNA invertase Pin-like site-specific DNA recombinase